MRRREFLGALGGAVTAWPAVARAQQRLPVVGYLTTASTDAVQRIAIFQKALAETGHVDGKTIEIDHRVASQVAALVARAPALIAASGNFATLQAHAATKTIPIVFTLGGDPVAMGLVASFNHPGGNATGFSTLTTQSETKRLELMSEIVPNAQTLAVLINPNSATSEIKIRELNAAAKILGRQLQFFKASNEAEIDAAFSTVAERRAGPILIAADQVYGSQQPRLAALAARYAIATISPYRDFAMSGGLVSYGPRLDEGDRQFGLYAGRILKGEKPADLPVVQSSKLELVVNLKAAKTLGLKMPMTLLGRADEVIE
jgi:putative ABC transport system substrate-binding protein